MPPNRGRGSPQTRILQHAPRKRTNEAPLTPPFQSKNKFAPLQNIDDELDQDGASTNDNAQDAQVSPKIPPIYVYNISNYETFHTSLSNQTFDEFSVTHTKNSLKLNLSSIEDYRSITKSFNESEIQYHTYQFQTEKQLSVVIRNLPIPITEEMIFNELKELNFEVDTVTRLQNRYKNPIPIVAVLLKKSSPNIYSLNRLLHCVVSVEPRKPSTGIPQCTNCQRFSHTKKFCHLPPRCVKCAGDHHYTQYQKILETPAKCVNCNGDHPASYRGCTFYKDITKNKNKTIANPRHNNNYSNAIPKPANQHVCTNKDNTNDHFTYSSACKNNSNSNSTNNADSGNGFMKTLLPLINTFITQLMQKIIENLPVIINSLNQNTLGSP